MPKPEPAVLLEEIIACLDEVAPRLASEVRDRKDRDDMRQLFIWLNGKLEKTAQPKKLGDLMTELYFSIH